MSKRKYPETMQAGVWRGGPEIQIETIPVPRVEPGELLVQVEACGICPTDIKKVDLGLAAPPVVLGHEMVGRVVAAGEGAASFPGRRVALYHHVPCRTCRLCEVGRYSQCPGYKKTGTTAGFTPAGGGWAEYVKVLPWIAEGGGVVEIPETLPAEVGILMEPLNTCLKCLEALADREGCLIILGQGPVGLMLTALAREKGWEVYAVEPLKERRQRSLRFGAKTVFSPGRNLTRDLHEIAPPFGPDAAIAATESEEAIRSALQALRPGGRLVLFAHTRMGQPLQIDGGEVGVSEKQIIGSYSSSIELNEETKETLLNDRLPWNEFVTHKFPLKEINRALELARSPSPDSLKIAVIPREKTEEV